MQKLDAYVVIRIELKRLIAILFAEIQRLLEGREERQTTTGDSNPREGERPLARRGDALHGDQRTETRRLSPVTMATTHTRSRQGTYYFLLVMVLMSFKCTGSCLQRVPTYSEQMQQC